MKRTAALLFLVANLTWAQERPLRVAVLDFVDQTGLKSDAQLGGAIAPGALAEKGFIVLGKQLVNSGDYEVIDRRDFVSQIEKLQPQDMGSPTPAKPSFLQAAQQLRADVVLRGNIMSFSTGKQKVNQGGYATDLSTVTLRVSLEALDAKDGAIIAVADGSARQSFRQTEALSTELSEDDVLTMLDEAVDAALPVVKSKIAERQTDLAARATIKLSVKTSEDPALVEVDGLLIGSSPVTDFEVYRGDHVFTISKPGYQQITKRILFEKNTSIEVPMLRETLSAEERKQILEKANVDIISSDVPGLIINTTD